MPLHWDNVNGGSKEQACTEETGVDERKAALFTIEKGPFGQCETEGHPEGERESER